MRWQEQAACRGRNPRLWFGPADEQNPPVAERNLSPREQARIAKARAVCQGCPVRDNCLLHALSFPETYGIWGGTTRAQRRLMKKRPAIARLSRQCLDTVR